MPSYPLTRPSAAHDGGEWNRCRSLRGSAVNNLPVTHGQPLLGQAPSLVYLVCFVYLVEPDQRNKQDKPNNGLLTLADFFSILLARTIHDGSS
jgi:hypothetical protein